MCVNLFVFCVFFLVLIEIDLMFHLLVGNYEPQIQNLLFGGSSFLQVYQCNSKKVECCRVFFHYVQKINIFWTNYT